MLKSTFCFFLLAAMVSLNSCRSTKSITYLADMSDSAQFENQPPDPPRNLLKSGNSLYVHFQSSSEEVNMLYNATSAAQTGGTLNYSDPADQYVFGYTIDREGFITLPVMGKVKVGGLTQDEAQAKVQLTANQYLKDATVKLKLLNFKVTVMGEVKTPGVYYNYNDELNVFEAATLAGGFTDMARVDEVLVMRKTARGTESYRLDLTNKGVLSHPAYYLQPNDVIYAMPSKAKTFSINLPAISLFFSTIALLLVVRQF